MTYRITEIKMPEKDDEWGIVQINSLSNTYFRFEIVDGKLKLDTSFFADKEEDPEEKHKELKPDTELFKGVQKALDELEFSGICRQE
ncbi:hypothetical protein BV582_20840 [Bacillus paralicheniformis]|uniref:hypothetical protein n=1 Tax=Bacillus paralicheniformis TaxID=1648923 RepID=UPI000C75CB70|nr:hypothetical protein [Bacillus paralicheniformis]PLC14022.1 hypothetical protein BV582_20840 [Bacillus paralicheniformis]